MQNLRGEMVDDRTVDGAAFVCSQQENENSGCQKLKIEDYIIKAASRVGT